MAEGDKSLPGGTTRAGWEPRTCSYEKCGKPITHSGPKAVGAFYQLGVHTSSCGVYEAQVFCTCGGSKAFHPECHSRWWAERKEVGGG
jgi:hypothetical protein